MKVKASIPDWPDYMITSDAVVLSYKGKDRAERALKPCHGKVSLRRGGKTYTRSVRTLMLAAFWNPAPLAPTHCAAGHPYAGNLMRTRRPGRHCLKCHAARIARWRAKRATAR